MGLRGRAWQQAPYSSTWKLRMAAMGLTLPPSFTERAIIWNTPPPRASVRGSTTLSAHCRCRRCRDASSWCRRRGRTRRRWCSRRSILSAMMALRSMRKSGRKGDHYAVGGLRLNVPRARLRGILIHSSPFPLCVLAQHSTGGNAQWPTRPFAPMAILGRATRQ